MRLENREILLAHPSVEKFEKYKINIPAYKQETTITLLIAVNWLY